MFIKSKIDELPDIQKDAIILYYYHDMKAKDIAKITGANLSTVKSRLKQGKDKLKKNCLMRRITLKDRDNLNEMLNQYQVAPGKESDISMTILLGAGNDESYGAF